MPRRYCRGMDAPSADYLYKVFRTQIDVVLPGGVAVLNADDELVAQMARLSDGEVIFYASSLELPRVREHLSAGGRAVVAQGEQILLCQQSRVEARVSARLCHGWPGRCAGGGGDCLGAGCAALSDADGAGDLRYR